MGGRYNTRACRAVGFSNLNEEINVFYVENLFCVCIHRVNTFKINALENSFYLIWKLKFALSLWDFETILEQLHTDV